METTDYVSYPLALALKKAGFDWECDHYYTNGYVNDNPEDISRVVKLHSGRLYNHNMVISSDGECVSAPFLSQAQKWLREEWGIHINVCIYSDYSTDADGKVCDRWDFWGFDLYAVSGGKQIEDGDGEYDSYEQALSAGIAAALELIEKKGE